LGRNDSPLEYIATEYPEINTYKAFRDNIQLPVQLKNALLECKRFNILIYVSSISNVGLTDKLQSALTYCINNIPILRFKNVSIINLCQNFEIGYVLFTPLKNKTPIFRKVVNVISYKKNSRKPEETIFEGGLYVSQSRIIESSTSKKLRDQWWYKWQMGVPPCASGRLTQMTGTCWFNTALNMLLLSNISRKVLIVKWNSLSQEEKTKIKNFGGLENCLVKTAPLRTMLLIVIYNILILDEKSQTQQGNWIKELAGLTKSLYLTKTEAAYNDLKVKDLKDEYSDAGGYSHRGIDVLLGVLGIDFKVIQLDRVSEEYDAILSDMIKKDKVGKFTREDQKILDKYGNMFKKQKELWGKYVTETHPIYNITEMNSIIITPQWSEDTIPLYVHIHPEGTNHLPRGVPEIITVNNTRYILESAGLGLHPVSAHAIAGLRCGDVFYVYDSNNFIVKTDWHKGDILAYSELKQADYSEFKVNSLVYVKHDVWLKNKV
jgi:hypothetical protein